MGGNRQISRLRNKAKSAEDFADKLERGTDDSEIMRNVTASFRSEAESLRGLVFFLETIAQHGGHRR